MTQTRDPKTGQLFDDGRGRVRPLSGPESQSRNRSLLAVATTYAAATNKVSWPESANITELTFIASVAAAATDDYAIVSFNAGSDAIAAAWLDATIDSEADDVQWYKIPIGEKITLQFTSAITRADLLGVSCTPDVWMGAN